MRDSSTKAIPPVAAPVRVGSPCIDGGSGDGQGGGGGGGNGGSGCTRGGGDGGFGGGGRGFIKCGDVGQYAHAWQSQREQ